ncbi:hypothetical protein LEN26_002503 [Aphanomyces euteiches]|nr:hypothetical protein AeMF1_018995 [Aphanomyces euteiches]KAH9159118.1 hypothetical protein LEN26_002503 [Aphanomyces euteiches]KAH9193370.1 hypothetical protein AeNC1_004663 [Aphanomyces euteiches]
MTRIAYTALFFVNAILATALRAFGDGILKHLWSFETCNEAVGNPHCVGNQAVYRASFAMSIFFAIMACVSALSDRGFNNCCCLWCFQLPMYVIIFIGSYTIPNGFFYGYAWVARVASVLFILLQLVIIVDTVCACFPIVRILTLDTDYVRDYLITKMEASDADERASLLSYSQTSSFGWFWKSAFFALVLLTLGGSLVGIGFLYHYFAKCTLGCVFPSITLGAIIITAVLSITNWVGEGLLPPSILALYICFLCYESLSSNPDASCNPFLEYQASSTFNTIIAALIGAATITWTR